MKKVIDLNLGFSDAQNYSQRSYKQFFSKVFVKNQFLDELLEGNKYFLIGEKGTGKTAYATFLSNNNYKENNSSLKFISGTDYEKFYELKQSGKIDISGYTDIWKVILLLLVSKQIVDSETAVASFFKSDIKTIMHAIEEYYNKAFSPEIITAFKIVDKSELAAKLICKYVELGAGGENTVEFSEQRLQMNLFYIEKKFSDAIKNIKLRQNINLFIDGIDIRPSSIPYVNYIECIKGLANACWSLNTTLFANIKDSQGMIKVVLLVRPDIFNSLSLQNATNKLQDNSVYLDWRTTYSDYKYSFLYDMAKKLLQYDQEDFEGDIWEKYLPWENKNGAKYTDSAFVEILRISLSRPRDIQQILKFLQNITKRRKNDADTFLYELFISDEFQNAYSDYFLSSLKDQLSFYYSDVDFRHFIKFFDLFPNASFSFEEYKTVYQKYTDYILENAEEIPEFVDDPKKFLQLLYDSNIILAKENTENPFYHFSYREKSSSNIAPEVPIGENYTYKFHYGLYKKVKFGRYN